MNGEQEALLQTESKNKDEELGLFSFRAISYGTNDKIRSVPKDERITYTWADLNVFTSDKQKSRWPLSFGGQPERKHILKNVCGVAYPGELLAILGSSGAGKTTLLNSLTFRSTANSVVTGLICSNGAPLTQTCLTSQSGYVQQDDLFFANLTVREHLIFHALVRMDSHLPYKQRIRRVDEVISELSLTKCQNTRIGNPGNGISGGERKRLAFASEVLTDPSLLFCDEPTSGLDSFMAQNVVQVLKNLAKAGKTIICTIHQPSSELYAMFDKVLYMAEGKTAFLGTPDEANLFFTGLNAPCPTNYNPADYYIQLLALVPDEEESCLQAINMICTNFERGEFGKNILSVTDKVSKLEVSYDFWTGTDGDSCPYKASCISQFKAVLWRSWISVMKEPMLIKVRLFQTAIVAFVIGFIYFGQALTEDGVMNINGAMFIFLTSMTFQNIFAVVTVFCADFPVFFREHTNGMYSTGVYFLCKTLAEMPLFIFLPVLYTGVCYYMIGLNPDVDRFFTAIAIIVLVANVAISFGYLISCATTSASMALAIGPPLVISFLLFGGFFLNISSIPIYLKWLSYFSWFRYANEALMINQWSNIELINCTTTSTTCPRNGAVILEIYNFSKENFTMDMVMLCVLILLFRLLAYFALLFRTLKRD